MVCPRMNLKKRMDAVIISDRFDLWHDCMQVPVFTIIPPPNSVNIYSELFGKLETLFEYFSYLKSPVELCPAVTNFSMLSSAWVPQINNSASNSRSEYNDLAFTS